VRRLIASSILGCLLMGAGAVVASATNIKAKFPDVTYPDGTAGVILAGSKVTNKSQFTNCDYFDPNGAYLGMFQSDEFATADFTALGEFCLDHFADRE
jgi:hypothetical protein